MLATLFVALLFSRDDNVDIVIIGSEWSHLLNIPSVYCVNMVCYNVWLANKYTSNSIQQTLEAAIQHMHQRKNIIFIYTVYNLDSKTHVPEE